jgi:hypothetical protein
MGGPALRGGHRLCREMPVAQRLIVSTDVAPSKYQQSRPLFFICSCPRADFAHRKPLVAAATRPFLPDLNVLKPRFDREPAALARAVDDSM